MIVVARLCALLLLLLGWGAAQSAMAQSLDRITAIARGAETAVQTIRDGCTLDLAAKPVTLQTRGTTTHLRYRRQGGCRAIAWERESAAIADLLAALLPRIAAKPRPSLFYWGRIEQPALQQRVVRAALAADLTRLDEGPELNRRTAEALNAAEVFTELRVAFAAHGLALTVHGVEKVERARPLELDRWPIDRAAFGRVTQDMRIPIAAQLWFAVAPLAP
jgi:hypothetical protein